MNNTKDFNTIKQLRNDLNNIFTEIDMKLNALTHIYTDMVKTHVDKNYTLGLDSFYFQNQLIQMEYDNMKTIYNFIDNRIYCEYYKLLKMLYEFINKEIKDKGAVEKILITHKHYPIYKDLEPSKIYDFNITTEINNTINNIIQELKILLNSKKEELDEKNKHSEMGINIDSIIHEQNYTIILLEERIHMFENYLNTFGNHHSKYFSRLIIKPKIMLGIVNEDFHLKQSKSLHLKRKPNNNNNNNNNLTLEISNTLQQATSFTENSDSNSISSNNSSEATTPKTSMNNEEENNVRNLIGITDSNKEVESELNTILKHIPESENEKTGLRCSIKQNNAII